MPPFSDGLPAAKGDRSGLHLVSGGLAASPTALPSSARDHCLIGLPQRPLRRQPVPPCLDKFQATGQVALAQRFLLHCQEQLGQQVTEASHLARPGQVEGFAQGPQFLHALGGHVLLPALLLEYRLQVLRPLRGTLWVLRPPPPARP